jgi:hypothetical protein
MPTWYKFLGGQGDSNMQQSMQASSMTDDSKPFALVLVYAYTKFLFLCLLLYGGWILLQSDSRTPLLWTLLGFSQCLGMMLLVLPQGVIHMDAADLQYATHGWYGQTAVAMVFRDFSYLLFCVAAMCWIVLCEGWEKFAIRLHNRRVRKRNAPAAAKALAKKEKAAASTKLAPKKMVVWSNDLGLSGDYYKVDDVVMTPPPKSTTRTPQQESYELI